MFEVKSTPTVERYCPNGHPPLPDLRSEDDHSIKFCPICGTPIEERPITYDAAYCANCNNLVNPTWNYCPYCGQGRENETS
ncbi:hypothetical protein ES703_58412 [subsurface metagenome]